MMLETGKNIEYFELIYLQVKQAIFMERSIVPSGQTVNAVNHSRVNPGLRLFKDVVITQHADCIGNVYKMITPMQKCTLL